MWPGGPMMCIRFEFDGGKKRLKKIWKNDAGKIDLRRVRECARVPEIRMSGRESKSVEYEAEDEEEGAGEARLEQEEALRREEIQRLRREKMMLKQQQQKMKLKLKQLGEDEPSSPELLPLPSSFSPHP